MDMNLSSSAASQIYGNHSVAEWLGIGSTARDKEWQEYMSNTAYQRSVGDLQSAGLNPVLAATNGATNSAGSVAAGQGTKAVSDIINSAIRMSKSNSDGELDKIGKSVQITGSAYQIARLAAAFA